MEELVVVEKMTMEVLMVAMGTVKKQSWSHLCQKLLCHLLQMSLVALARQSVHVSPFST